MIGDFGPRWWLKIHPFPEVLARLPPFMAALGAGQLIVGHGLGYDGRWRVCRVQRAVRMRQEVEHVYQCLVMGHIGAPWGAA